MTQVMSGQVDIGYSVAPFALQELASGQLRLVGRATEAPDLAKQSIRVIFVNSHVLAERRDAMVRFMKALRRTLAWMYSDDPRVIQWYAEGANVPLDVARRARDEFEPQWAVVLGAPTGLDISVRQAVAFKYVKTPPSAEQLASYIDVIDGK
jgi:NitT/TauT family transport system substrate-binding protein